VKICALDAEQLVEQKSISLREGSYGEFEEGQLQEQEGDHG
jgi:hypothetical protein